MSKILMCLIGCFKPASQSKREFSLFEKILLAVSILPVFLITVVWFFSIEFNELDKLGWFERVFVYIFVFVAVFLIVFIGYSALLIAVAVLLGLASLVLMVIFFVVSLFLGILRFLIR